MQLSYLTQRMTMTDGDGERVQVIGRSVFYVFPSPSPWFLSQTGAARQIEDMHRHTQCHGSKCLIHIAEN